MKYLDLNTIKHHVNIDSDFLADDEYLRELSDAAISAIQNHISRPISEITQRGKLPPDVKHAALLIIAHWYAIREPVAFAQNSKIALTYDYLLQPYKSYKFDTSFGV